ncbi:hypothetical protein EZV62_027696 [Acer yangbiense]|uniref:Protein kinase domain-containing protein n=1 Tax=Acer yangbiense TaxID=1000413 RepID=A0A5C7GVM1_9ROSI|nr:hypothetical protein EZV62_027696 [Acer yangbiense]
MYLKQVLSLVIVVIMCFLSGFVLCDEFQEVSAALLELKKSFTEDPLNVLIDWSEETNKNLCAWRGITCDHDSVHVVSLNLSGSSLGGSISPSLGLLKNLTHLDLSNNNLMGPIPTTLSELSSLESLSLFSNQLTGSIPTQLGSLTGLRVLRIGDNWLTGQIPNSFGGLVNLVNLALASCSLTGQIPPQLGRLNQLESLILQDNQLEGPIPVELGNCSSLTLFTAALNNLNGSITAELGRLRNLQLLNLANNSLSGEIPSELGELSQLGYLNLLGNKLEGPIPRSFSKLGSLQNLDLSMNMLSGGIPEEFGDMGQLVYIVLSNNNISGTIPGNMCTNNTNLESLVLSGIQLSDLNFLHLRQNELVGQIPASLGNCNQLTILDLADNNLSGGIPESFGFLQALEQLMLYNNSLEGNLPGSLINLANLTRINFSKNRFNGSISALCSSRKFLSFDVTNNAFDGEIPPQLGNSINLERLRIGNNKFSGKIPLTLGKIHELSLLDLSGNSITGEIPPQVLLCKKLTHIDLNKNLLSGPIPMWLGSLPQLGELKLSSNQFFGSLPRELFNCSKLLVLALDDNLLNGSIPEEVEVGEMVSLGKLDLSYNSLQGKLSKQFSDWPAKVFEGNAHLCGGPLDRCSAPVANRQSTLSEPALVAISVLSTLSAIALLIVVILLYLKHKQEFLRKVGEVNFTHSSGSSQAQRRLLFQHGTAKRDLKWEDIMEATNNLSDEFIIGSGGSGTIYKAELHNGTTIAVKKISCKDDLLSNKSFTTEIKTLGRIRHRHLVKLMGYCCNKGSGSNLLIYDYMENGNDTFGVDMDMVRWVETHIEMAGSPREELISERLKPLFPVEECAAYQVLEIALQCTKTSPQERPTSRIVCDLLLQVLNNRTVDFDKINVDSYT